MNHDDTPTEIHQYAGRLYRHEDHRDPGRIMYLHRRDPAAREEYNRAVDGILRNLAKKVNVKPATSTASSS